MNPPQAKYAESSRDLLICRPDWVPRRIGRWLGGLVDRANGRSRSQMTAQRDSWFVPRITTLEPRIVLNATAELSAVSGLLIFGDLADDTVQFNIVGSGDSIQLTDADGNIIPIDGNTDGPTGSETDPLAISQIHNGLVTVDLGGGNDLLQIELPDAINLTVLENAGDDRTEVDVQPASSPSPATTVLIASETIDLTPSGPSIQFADRDVHLIGDVFVGSSSPSGATEIDIGIGTFEIDGTLTLGGTLRLIGDSGDVDWRDATISASVADVDLFFELDQTAGSSVAIGEVNDAAGHLIDDLRIDSSTDTTFTADVAIDSDLTVNALSSVSFDGAVSAGDIGVGADRITASDTISSDSGSIVFTANDQLTFGGDIESVSAGVDGNISLVAANLSFADTSITTAGANILIRGSSQIAGDVFVDSAQGPTVLQGGDVVWAGPITSSSSSSSPAQPGWLTINANGANQGGSVELNGDIGGVAAGSLEDLQSVVVTADQIAISNIGVDGGLISLTADQIRVIGSTIRSSDSSGSGDGSIEINGDMTFHRIATEVTAANDLLIDGSIRVNSDSNSLALSAGDSAVVRGELRGGNQLSIQSQATLGVEANLIDWRGITLSASDGIQIAAERIESSDSIVIQDAVVIETDSLTDSILVTSEIVFGSTVTVATGQVVEIDAAMINSAGQSVLEKLGDGELVLLRENMISTDLSITAGTLRVDGSIASTSTVDVHAGAVLAGSGAIAGAVTIHGGTLDPNGFVASGRTGQLSVGSIVFESGSVFAVDVDGSTVGQTLDSVAVDDTPIQLSGTLLELDVAVTLPGDTELLIVQNDSAGQVSGRFLSNTDAFGNPLATPRVLEEGALVLARFGPGAGAVPAYITYFGGDGNDVTIVTSGDNVINAGNVTLVSRSGVNLHVQTGDTLADAMLAAPTIRPIEGFNGGSVFIDAMAPHAQLFIDIDGFVDTGPNPLNFDADIVFDTIHVGGNASVTLFDSDLGTVDSPDQFDTVFIGSQDIQLTFNHDESVAPDYRVLMRGVTQVDLELPSLAFNSRLSGGDDQLTVVADSDPAFSLLQLTTDNLSNQFRFLHPDHVLLVDGFGGDDVLQFNSFGANLNAVPTVVGGDGFDALIWNADVDVGVASTIRDLSFDAESVTIAGDIRLVGGGTIHVVANDQLLVSSTVDATTGKIVIESGAAQSDLSASTLLSSASEHSIALHGGDYRLGDVVATTGTLVLGTDDGLGAIGSVEQANGSRIDASHVTAASSGTLMLDSIMNRIDEVDLNADGGVTVFDSTGDLIVSIDAGDSIDVRVANDLVLQSALASSGATRLAAAGNIRGIAVQPAVHVAGESVELLAGVPFPGQTLPPATVASIGSSVIPIRVAASQLFSASTNGTNGSIFIESPRGGSFPPGSGQLAIGLVDAGSGRIEIDAATIDDAFASSDVNLIGAEISLHADSGIGASVPLTVTGVADLQAVSVVGSIVMDVIADRTVSLSSVVTGGGAGDQILIQHFGDHRLSILEVANADGSISILTGTASIDVLQHATGDALFAGGTGNILLQNLGGESDITVRGGIGSETGSVDLVASRNVIFTPRGHLHSTDGAVTLRGGNGSGLLGSTIDLQDGSQIDVGSGTALLNTPGDIFASSIRSTNPGDAITILTPHGSLIDSGDQHTDLVADSGVVRIDVASGIGSGNPLETRIDSLFGFVRQSGSLEIDEETALTLVDVSTADGMIDVIAVGTMTVDQVRSVNASGLDGSQHRDIHLVTTGWASDILVRSLVAENVTDIDLVAADDVIRFGSDSLLVADDLRIASSNGSDDGPDAVRLNTNVNDLEISVFGSSRGDIQIDELDSISLASSDRADDTEVILTTNGEIRIHAAESIFVSDPMLVDDQASLRADVEILAGGANGRIHLSSGQEMVLGDSVQLMADQSTAGAVVLESAHVVLGQDFQIETGDSVGVARIFAPRPDVGVVDTAFYESTSVATSPLEQSGSNDAKGVLSMDVGNQGERGLTINIDWGAETNRFQQIDHLSGDAAPLQVDHVYLESDIVFSRLNGRSSATDPLEVRFAVRHHESILVLGQTIEQGTSGVQIVAGELISSTDNPQTPGLENGTAQFSVPALSIPVAFFPVRDVIPVIEQSVIIVGVEQTFVVLGSGLESSETVGSSVTVREEYFQIRVLSPDPDGEDLVPPMRLPDDVISGDKLQTLFRSLPDGRYDIQYVLGDGNVRSILSVDLRDGKPILPGDDAEAGMLRLIPVEPESLPDAFDDTSGSSEDDQPDPLDQSRSAPPLIRIDPAEGMKRNTDSDADPFGRLSVAGRLRSRGLQYARASAGVGEYH